MAGNSSPAASIVERFGGQTALARAIGVSQGTVWGWVNTGRIPYSRIDAIVEAARKLEPPLVLDGNDFVRVRQPHGQAA